MRKSLLGIVLSVGLAGCVDQISEYNLFEATAREGVISLKNGIMVTSFPEHRSMNLTQADMDNRLEWILTVKDRHVAALKLDDGINLNKEPLLEVIEAPKKGGALVLNGTGLKAEIGKWTGNFRLLLVPMKTSELGAKNMVVGAQKAMAVIKGKHNIELTLEGVDAKALGYNGKQFELPSVNAPEFDKLWKEFIEKDNPNGFLSFRDAAGHGKKLPLEFTHGTMNGSGMTLQAAVLGKEATAQLAAELQTAKGIVVFVDPEGGGFDMFG